MPDLSSMEEQTLSEQLFLNRELSWLAFNQRVLEEAEDTSTPLLERLKFLGIFTANLDEFFMVRVAGMKKMLKEGFVTCDSPDQMPIAEAIKKIHQKVLDLTQSQYRCFQQVLSELEKETISIVEVKDLNQEAILKLTDYFRTHIFPVLTPLAVDPSHPYPFLTNLSIYIIAEFCLPANFVAERLPLGFVEIPSVLPRLIRLEASKGVFVRLEDVIAYHLEELFHGFKIHRSSFVRVTRNLDYTLLESRVVDLLESIQKVVSLRQHQEPVRLEIPEDAPMDLIDELIEVLHLNKETDVYRVCGPFYLAAFMELYKEPLPHLKDEAFNPRLPVRMVGTKNIFALIRQQDLLVHHPYESFYAVTEFLGEAANDPNVLAIKQTLYRSSGDSPIIDSLIKAAENGKQVTAVIELKARFDEKNNIIWARNLERAGVNVVYGFVGLKTHCKATIVVRKEQQGLVRYVHLSTGNYNSQTAKIYTDIGLFTCMPEIGEDVSALFNLLTGFNVIQEDGLIRSNISFPKFKKIVLAPIDLRSWLLNQIDDLISAQKRGEKTKLIAKINALVDSSIIKKLYEASRYGVQIILNVRSICCLRPGVKDMSESIQVFSIVDRFLEHSRIYAFQTEKEERVYLSSADWMGRSMTRRIEMVFPVEDKQIKKRILQEILGTLLADNQKSRYLNPDGSYEKKPLPANSVPLRSQSQFIAFAREAGVKSIPYEKAMKLYKGRKKDLNPMVTKNIKG